MKRFGEKLTRLLDERRVTKKEVADSLGIHPSAVTNWTKSAGKNQPSVDQLLRISKQFGVLMDSLADDDVVEPLPRTGSGAIAGVDVTSRAVMIQALVALLGEEQALERLSLKWVVIGRTVAERKEALVLEDSTEPGSAAGRVLHQGKESSPGPLKGSTTRRSRGS